MGDPTKISGLLGNAFLETIRQAVREEFQAVVGRFEQAENSFQKGRKSSSSLLTVDELSKILKTEIKPRYVKERKGDVKQIYLNAKKAKEQLGWRAKTSLREGLIDTIKWFKKK